MKKLIEKQNGSILIATLITIILLMGLGAGLFSLVLANSLKVQRSYMNIAALSYAEAALEKSMWELNNDQEMSCNPSCTIGNSEVYLDVSIIDSENKELTATAYVPTYLNPKAKKKIKLNISGEPASTAIAFNYAIQSGAGGIEISGSSIVKGSLYSNGNIAVQGAAAEVKDPGDAWAVGIIDDPRNGIKGSKNPGAAPMSMPSIDLDQWKNASTAGGTIAGNYSPPNDDTYTDFGPKKITGNLTMSSSTQKINLTGPLYIQGNLSLSGGFWKLDDSFGSNGTLVLVDGLIDISGTVKFLGNSSGSYILFVSTNAANTKLNPAVRYIGSAEGEKLALYAYNGSMKLGGSGKIIALCGQTLFIEGSSEIEYEEGMENANFSIGPGGFWLKKSWQEMKL